MVEDKIKLSDFVVAVISLKAPNTQTHYEIGLAQGLRKPIFLIIQDEGSLPKYLKDMVYVKASINDIDPISFMLDQFLSKYERPVKKQIPKPMKSKLKPISKTLSEKLEKLTEKGKENQLVNFMEDLLTSQGIIFNLDWGVEKERVDLSLWIDSLESSLGNPILAELKAGQLSESRLKRAEDQLRRHIKKTNSRAGLLIYLDWKNRRFKRSIYKLPLVIRFDLRDLVKDLSNHPIDQVLLSERNRIVHGD